MDDALPKFIPEWVKWLLHLLFHTNLMKELLCVQAYGAGMWVCVGHMHTLAVTYNFSPSLPGPGL